MDEAAKKHRDDNKTFLDDYDAAKQIVDDLTKAAAKQSGDDTAQKERKKELEDLEKATADGVKAVEDARTRLAALIDAQRTQEYEEAALEERKEAADKLL